MHETIVKGILSNKNGINIYRGCSHGCIYCDSRSKCYQILHDFEDIEIKSNAPELLEKALSSKRNPCMISTGSMSDPYIQLENNLHNTEKCLKIIRKYHCGAVIQTKSTGILRDLDLLKSINEDSKCVVNMTLTTFDEKLCRVLEPNVATTAERFEVLKIMRDAGIPTVVWLTPILPFINDTETNIRGILDYCIAAKVRGIICFNMGLTLREGNREYFYQKLDEHFPRLKERYIRTYGNAYEIISPDNYRLMQIFRQICSQNGIETDNRKIFEYMKEYPSREDLQLSLF